MAHPSSHLLPDHHYAERQALSSHCFYHSLLSSATELDSAREKKIASDMFTAFSKTLTAGSLIAECGGAQKLKWK